jgi:hypothetical protein
MVRSLATITTTIINISTVRPFSSNILSVVWLGRPVACFPCCLAESFPRPLLHAAAV